MKLKDSYSFNIWSNYSCHFLKVPPKNAGLVVFGFELKLIKFSVFVALSFVVFVLILYSFKWSFIISVYDEKWCQNGDLVTKAVMKEEKI